MKWWTQNSSIVMNWCKNSAQLRRNIVKHSFETSSRPCFCFIVSKRCTHLKHSFLVSKFSDNMRRAALFKLPATSVSSRTFIRRSSNTILWTFSPFLAWSPHLVDHCDVRLGRTLTRQQCFSLWEHVFIIILWTRRNLFVPQYIIFGTQSRCEKNYKWNYVFVVAVSAQHLVRVCACVNVYKRQRLPTK